MLDVAFYGLGLNQSIVLEAIGFAKKHDPYEVYYIILCFFFKCSAIFIILEPI